MKQLTIEQLNDLLKRRIKKWCAANAKTFVEFCHSINYSDASVYLALNNTNTNRNKLVRTVMIEKLKLKVKVIHSQTLFEINS